MLKSCFSDTLILPVLLSFYSFHQNSKLKIHKWGSVFNFGSIPQVLGCFLIGPNLNEASETLKPLGTVAELATKSYFWLYLLY